MLAVVQTHDTPPAKLVLTIAETAEILGISTDTVQRLIKAGQIRTVRWHARLVRVPVKTLHEDIARLTSASGEPSSSAAATQGEASPSDPLDA